jgi:chromosome segregation ATPase
MDFTTLVSVDPSTTLTKEYNQAEGIEAIAARIHDRAVQLATQQGALRSAKQELSNTQEDLAKEIDLRQRVRKEFLKCLSQANAIELECIDIQERIEDRMFKTKKLKEKEKEMVAQFSKRESEWEMAQELLTRHKLRQEVYLKILRGVINKRNQAAAFRQKRVERVIQLCETLKDEKESVELDQIRLRDNILRLTEFENDDNKAVETLASQVREAITRVSARFCLHNALCDDLS